MAPLVVHYTGPVFRRISSHQITHSTDLDQGGIPDPDVFLYMPGHSTRAVLAIAKHALRREYLGTTVPYLDESALTNLRLIHRSFKELSLQAPSSESESPISFYRYSILTRGNGMPFTAISGLSRSWFS